MYQICFEMMQLRSVVFSFVKIVLSGFAQLIASGEVEHSDERSFQVLINIASERVSWTWILGVRQ